MKWRSYPAVLLVRKALSSDISLPPLPKSRADGTCVSNRSVLFVRHRSSLTRMQCPILRRSWILTFALLLCTAGSLSAQPTASARQLTQQIDRVIEQEPFENALWGIHVTDLAGREVIYSHNGEKSFIPASNVKLYVTAAVLDQLGPGYTYETPLHAAGPIRGGVLEGPLVVRGSGDPTISGRFHEGDRTAVFEQWASALRRAGIESVAGDVIGDDDVFDDVPLGEGWSWDDIPYWYAAEISGLSFNDNAVDLVVRARQPGMPAQINWQPRNTDYITVNNRSRTLTASADYEEEYRRPLEVNRFTVASELPAGQSDRESLTVTNPTLYFTHVLRETLLRSGIAIAGDPVDVDALSIKPDYTAPGLRTVATYTSPPLSDIVQVANTRSQNLFAEQLLKTLAAERPIDADDPLYDDDMESGSAEMGIASAMATFAAAGLDTSRISLADGSGLSRKNLVTPKMTVRLLRYMQNSVDEGTSSAFYTSLPLGGVSGTLRYRFDRGRARNNVRAKTGSLSHVSALSGYVQTPTGRMLTFSIFCNSYTVSSSAARAAIDQIVNILASYQP